MEFNPIIHENLCNLRLPVRHRTQIGNLDGIAFDLTELWNMTIVLKTSGMIQKKSCLLSTARGEKVVIQNLIWNRFRVNSCTSGLISNGLVSERTIIMHLTIDIEQEEDGRWLSEVLELPGVMAYGETQKEAIVKVQTLTLRVLADRLEHGE